MNAYLRAAKKSPQLKLQGKERLDKRQGKPVKTAPPKTKPAKPPKDK
jgi:hypothetical protein